MVRLSTVLFKVRCLARISAASMLLFLFALLDVRTLSTEIRAGVEVRDIRFANTGEGRTQAYILHPPARGRYAGVLFARWMFCWQRRGLTATALRSQSRFWRDVWGRDGRGGTAGEGLGAASWDDVVQRLAPPGGEARRRRSGEGGGGTGSAGPSPVYRDGIACAGVVSIPTVGPVRSGEQIAGFFGAAKEPREIRFYDVGHWLDAAAAEDRQAWLKAPSEYALLRRPAE